jgi:hypothetical protein
VLENAADKPACRLEVQVAPFVPALVVDRF